MALLFTLSIVCAVALSSTRDGNNTDHPGIYCLASLLCVLIPIALAVAFRTRILRSLDRDPDNARRYMRAFLHSERCVAFIWFASTCLLMFLCRWPAVVRYNWNLREAVLLDELLILMPIVLPLFLHKAIQFDVEYWASQQARSRRPRPASRWRFAWEQSRVYVGIAIVPILLLTFCWDLSRVFLPRYAHGSLGWMLLLLPLAVLFVAFPLLLRFLCATTKLSDGSLRTRLFQLADRAQLPVRNVVVWHTPCQSPNASVTGILPSLTYVFLTDELMKQLDDDEITAAFAHELGHIGCNHSAFRMFALLLPVTLFGLFFKLLAGDVSLATKAHASLFAQPGICLFITLVYLVFVFGCSAGNWNTKRTSLPADC